MDSYTDDDTSGNLNVESVLIYPTADGSGVALAADAVEVTFDEDFEIFVFNPDDDLGSPAPTTGCITTNIEIRRRVGIHGRYWMVTLTQVSTDRPYSPSTLWFLNKMQMKRAMSPSK